MKRLLTHIVKKKEVERKNFDRIYEVVRHCNRQGKAAYGTLEILFDGWNDIVDEVHDIPVIREWVKELVETYPHIFYFLAADKNQEARRIILSCYVDVKTSYNGEKLSATSILRRGLTREHFPKITFYHHLTKEKKVSLISQNLLFASNLKDDKGAKELADWLHLHIDGVEEGAQ